MVNLIALEEFLKNSENLNVVMTESGLVVTEKSIDEKNIIPSDLTSFVSVYEQSEITADGSGYIITVERMSAHNFLKLLMSVFSTEYNFEVVGEYVIKATKKSANEDLEDSKNEDADKIEISFEEIAEAIDSEKIEVEIHEDGLKVVCSNLSEIAEKIDSLNPNLDIEIEEKYLTVTHGA